ncbi:MAG: hypothetical protein RML99_09740, partial [Anaerolineae bacterium]|nr:hypothetical protein [Anaerolineae bacterium]
CLAAGEVETAHRHYAAAQAIYEQIAARRDQSRNLIRLARAERALGRSESAVAHLVAAARLADAVQDDGLCRQALDLLAEACAATRDRRALDDLLDALIAAHPQDTELRARRGDAGQGS